MRRFSVILALLLTLAGCGLPLTDAQRRQSPEGQLLMRFFDAVRTKDRAFIKAHLAPRHVASPDFEAVLDRTSGMVPDGTPTLVGFLDWSITFNTDTGRSVSLSARYDFPRASIVVLGTLVGKDQTLKVDHFYIVEIDPKTGEVKDGPAATPIAYRATDSGLQSSGSIGAFRGPIGRP